MGGNPDMPYKDRPASTRATEEIRSAAAFNLGKPGDPRWNYREGLSNLNKAAATPAEIRTARQRKWTTFVKDVETGHKRERKNVVVGFRPVLRTRISPPTTEIITYARLGSNYQISRTAAEGVHSWHLELTHLAARQGLGQMAVGTMALRYRHQGQALAPRAKDQESRTA